MIDGNLELPFQSVFTSINSYGGKQVVFKDLFNNQYLEKRGCGIIAASHILIYNAYNNESLRSLFPYAEFDRKNYHQFLIDLNKVIKPTPIGIITERQFSTMLKKYAKQRGVQLEPVQNSMDWSIDCIARYIHEGLLVNQPVLLLTWNTKISDLKHHWVTITGIEKSGDQYHIVTSNWGQKKKYNLNQWVEDRSLYQAVVYFRWKKEEY